MLKRAFISSVAVVGVFGGFRLAYAAPEGMSELLQEYGFTLGEYIQNGFEVKAYVGENHVLVQKGEHFAICPVVISKKGVSLPACHGDPANEHEASEKLKKQIEGK